MCNAAARKNNCVRSIRSEPSSILETVLRVAPCQPARSNSSAKSPCVQLCWQRSLATCRPMKFRCFIANQVLPKFLAPGCYEFITTFHSRPIALSANFFDGGIHRRARNKFGISWAKKIQPYFYQNSGRWVVMKSSQLFSQRLHGSQKFFRAVAVAEPEMIFNFMAHFLPQFTRTGCNEFITTFGNSKADGSRHGTAR